MTDIVMPRLSDSMEEGTILRWLKAEGDQVARGEEIVEIETDKATMTYAADAAGVLAIVAGEGSSLAVGELIATIGEGRGNGAGAASRAEEATYERIADADESEPEPVSAPAPASAPAPPAEPVAPTGERVKASPVARRMARELGIDVATLQGSGPGGRVVKADVKAAGKQIEAGRTPVPSTSAPPAQPSTAKGGMRVEELSRTQQTIARRMAESRATVPDFTLTLDIDMQEAVVLREQLRALPERDASPPSYNDMVVKAAALALREFPRANGSYRDGHFELHDRVNVGVAVAAPDALVVPVITDADTRTLSQIASESRALAAKVREQRITPPEVAGATFTVSNLGMFGVTHFTAVINPPQAAILSVGALQQRAVIRDGEIVARHVMTVTLACDHRILYGADGAQFLARVRELLEHPLALLA